MSFKHLAIAAVVTVAVPNVASAATMINLQPYVNSNVSQYSGGSAYPQGSTTIGGITFNLAAAPNGQNGTGIIQLGNPSSVSIAAAASNVDTAYVIVNSIYGNGGRTSGFLTFNGATAGTPIALVQGINIRDHFANGQTNGFTSPFATANYSTGARFDVYRYDISALGGTLASIGFRCDGNCNNDAGVPFLAGVTLTSEAAVAAVPEPATWAMMLAGFGMIGFALRRRGNVKTTVRFA